MLEPTQCFGYIELKSHGVQWVTPPCSETRNRRLDASFRTPNGSTHILCSHDKQILVQRFSTWNPARFVGLERFGFLALAPRSRPLQVQHLTLAQGRTRGIAAGMNETCDTRNDCTNSYLWCNKGVCWLTLIALPRRQRPDFCQRSETAVGEWVGSQEERQPKHITKKVGPPTDVGKCCNQSDGTSLECPAAWWGGNLKGE